MDFSPVALTEAQQAFAEEVRAFLDEHLTEEVYARKRERADSFDEGLYVALGSKGWLWPRWRREDGGAELDDVCVRLLETELLRREAPLLSGTPLIWPGVEAHADPELRAELKPQVARGTVRICMGYTEPDGGSDIAGAKTRAVRDGDEWVINGQKIFTTGAQYCQYVFLITRTDPALPKHKGLTMFLVPLNSEGIEIQALLHDRRRADEHRVLRRCPRLRPVPDRGGQQRLVRPARAAGRRALHRGHRQQARRSEPVRAPRAAPGAIGRGRRALGQDRPGQRWARD